MVGIPPINSDEWWIDYYCYTNISLAGQVCDYKVTDDEISMLS